MRAAGATPRRAVAVGGGAQSELLLQIVSDVTGMEQELPDKTIGACYGDAFLAGLAVGLLSQADLPSRWVRIIKHVTPDADRHRLYQEYYDIYRDLYPHTVGDVHALARLGARA
jgi:xylulokinase